MRASERYANEGITGMGRFVPVLLGTPEELCRTAPELSHGGIGKLEHLSTC